MSIQDELSSVKKGQNVITVISEEKYFHVISEVLHYLINKNGLSGVYISISKPYEKVIAETKGVNWDKILFLDGISRRLNKKEPKNKSCIYLQGPSSLTEIGIYLTKAINTGKASFVILDSLAGLISYNSESTSLRFIHYIISKSKNMEIIGIIVAHNNGEEKKIIEAVKDVADKAIKI